MEGFLNINKPQGLTSFDVIRRVTRLFPRKTKIGHLGTLDPMASGVLPVAVGSATKVIPFIDNESKEYIADITFGGVSDTQDAWGNITYTGRSKDFDTDKLQEILNSFRGVISQVPPMYSAVHHQGKRLYDLARQGITVERASREIEIKDIDVIDINLSGDLPCIKMKIICSKGTYIRTLCHDIGQTLGMGAFLSGLVRIRSGMFDIENSYTIEHLLSLNNIAIGQVLLPIDYPIMNMPVINLNAGEKSILNGNKITIDKKYNPGENIRAYASNGQLIAIAQAVQENNQIELRPVRVFK
ncbi:MAG: tRNA pseudouridine(55) synthase TruB [Syntrophomonadaceae bacterium]|nr:tRNA pseudouridine(55) synthase TruB [Syntrophomonadaceae bacterium]MDD3888652.1 tRNA pseudouridine(55) synthase TruB [Syntrophomonadaceae bacterium]MDD4548275.1 tRNA pseudouridine(55) synthase TruB [Syntrophomonadaceae bacterium]